ncbi:NADH oxidase [Lactiplantibacillus paraplantarum]|uniref:NADH oxidase n=3 Tax=Lactiplantibacillus paraplantarum TaxID=60520 RepID=A0ABQ0N8U6_9LACO|nr:FAD-dependent oxidoreductase [Lactiplantibacillus paraplantarum]ERL44403.1 NADH oxidase [Lactiplantibacillus paraplantarum]KRL50450.1 NADH oxidase [Lactiplantibacillus paraplantarum DSM 10667]GBF01424.1 NADH oxidase [Lactiplantibacillus paraplantarum]GEO60344.1 NADH oxidase [Lactiplantibacillus paraplantarum]
MKAVVEKMKVAIIGCTHAGIAAMKQILKYYPGTEITVYERHADISYMSCGTYLHLGGTIKDLDQALYANSTEFSEQGVQMRMQYDVINVNADKHTILAQNLQTKELQTDHYDKLIMATGSITAIPAIPGVENPKVMLCKTCEQAQQLYEAAQHAHHIAIVGGGYSGVELAEGYVKSGHAVTLFQRGSHLINEYLDPQLSEKVEKLLTTNGIQVKTNAQVMAFSDTADNRLRVTTANGEETFDMAVICPGVIPQSELLAGQVNRTKQGAIVTDRYMGTSNPDIYAAGDVTEVNFNPTKDHAYMPLVSHAIRQGALAGINIFDKRLGSIGTQATTGMLIFDQTVACAGMTLTAAKAANFDAKEAFYEGNYRPDFMPTTEKVMITLVYDQQTRKVLGGQLISAHEVSQSANTLSVVIHNGNTIDELAFMDMLFSPNFDEPFNYLNLVAQAAVDQEHGYRRNN